MTHNSVRRMPSFTTAIGRDIVAGADSVELATHGVFIMPGMFLEPGSAAPVTVSMVLLPASEENSMRAPSAESDESPIGYGYARFSPHITPVFCTPHGTHKLFPPGPHVELPDTPVVPAIWATPGGLRNLVHPVVMALLCSRELNLKM